MPPAPISCSSGYWAARAPEIRADGLLLMAGGSGRGSSRPGGRGGGTRNRWPSYFGDGEKMQRRAARVERLPPGETARREQASGEGLLTRRDSRDTVQAGDDALDAHSAI